MSRLRSIWLLAVIGALAPIMAIPIIPGTLAGTSLGTLAGMTLGTPRGIMAGINHGIGTARTCGVGPAGAGPVGDGAAGVIAPGSAALMAGTAVTGLLVGRILMAAGPLVSPAAVGVIVAVV